MPVSDGISLKKLLKASRPPADAPMPTVRNALGSLATGDALRGPRSAIFVLFVVSDLTPMAPQFSGEIRQFLQRNNINTSSESHSQRLGSSTRRSPLGRTHSRGNKLRSGAVWSSASVIASCHDAGEPVPDPCAFFNIARQSSARFISLRHAPDGWQAPAWLIGAGQIR